MPRRKTLLIDFDATIHQYTGWKGAELDEPISKARCAMYILEKQFRLVCFTTRPVEQVEPWLRKYGFPAMKVTNYKEPAEVIIDDRALQFRGVWDDILINQIRNFQPYWLSSTCLPAPDQSEEGQEPQTLPTQTSQDL